MGENPSWEWKNVNSFTPPSKSKGTAEYNQRWNEGYVHLLAEGIVRAAQAHHGNSVESIVAMTLMACRMLMEEGKEDNAMILWKHVSDLLQKPNILNMTAKQLSTYKSYEAEGKLPPEFEEIYPRKGEGIFGDIQKLLDEDPGLLGVVLAWTEIKSNQLLLSSQANVQGLAIDSIRHKDRVYCQMKSGPLQMLIPLGLRSPLHRFNTTWNKLQAAQQEKVIALIGRYETPLAIGRAEAKEEFASLTGHESVQACENALRKPKIVAKQEINLLLMKGDIPALGWIQDHIIEILSLYEPGADRDALFQILKERYPDYIEAVHILITEKPELSLRDAVIFGIPERISHDRAVWVQVRKDLDLEERENFDKLCFDRVVRVRPDIAAAILVGRVNDDAPWEEVSARFDAILASPKVDAAAFRPLFEEKSFWKNIPTEKMNSLFMKFVEIVMKGEPPDLKVLKKVLAQAQEMKDAVIYMQTALSALKEYKGKLMPLDLVEFLKAPIFLEHLHGPEDFGSIYKLLSTPSVLESYKERLFPARKDAVTPEFDFIDAVLCVGYCANKNAYSPQYKRIEEKGSVILRLLAKYNAEGSKELNVLPVPTKKGRTEGDETIIKEWISKQRDIIQVIKDEITYADLCDQIIPWMRELPPEKWESLFPEGIQNSEIAGKLGKYIREMLRQEPNPSREMLVVAARVFAQSPKQCGEILPELASMYTTCNEPSRILFADFIKTIIANRLPKDPEVLWKVRQQIGAFGVMEGWKEVDFSLVSANLNVPLSDEFQEFICSYFDIFYDLFKDSKGRETTLISLLQWKQKLSPDIPLSKDQATFFCNALSRYKGEGMGYVDFVASSISSGLLTSAEPEALAKYLLGALNSFAGVKGKDIQFGVIVKYLVSSIDSEHIPSDILREIFAKARKDPSLYTHLMPLSVLALERIQKPEDRIPIIKVTYENLKSNKPMWVLQGIPLLLDNAAGLGGPYVQSQIVALVRECDIPLEQLEKLFEYCFRSKEITKETWDLLFKYLNKIPPGESAYTLSKKLVALSAIYVNQSYVQEYTAAFTVLFHNLSFFSTIWKYEPLRDFLVNMNKKGSILFKILSQRPCTHEVMLFLWLFKYALAVTTPGRLSPADEELWKKLDEKKLDYLKTGKWIDTNEMWYQDAVNNSFTSVLLLSKGDNLIMKQVNFLNQTVLFPDEFVTVVKLLMHSEERFCEIANGHFSLLCDHLSPVRRQELLACTLWHCARDLKWHSPEVKSVMKGIFLRYAMNEDLPPSELLRLAMTWTGSKRDHIQASPIFIKIVEEVMSDLHELQRFHGLEEKYNEFLGHSHLQQALYVLDYHFQYSPPALQEVLSELILQISKENVQMSAGEFVIIMTRCGLFKKHVPEVWQALFTIYSRIPQASKESSLNNTIFTLCSNYVIRD